MSDFFNKLSSYNLFNYLLPGVIFAVLADAFTQYKFIKDNIILGLFVYYFIGMIISRLGSLIIEPLLKKTRFLIFAEYEDYVSASKKDEKVNLLSEVNNTFRTICSLSMSLLFLKLFGTIAAKYSWLNQRSDLILIIFLLILFLFSYRKQTSYLKKRVQANVDGNINKEEKQ